MFLKRHIKIFSKNQIFGGEHLLQFLGKFVQYEEQ